jgi:hypothetical protein
MSAEPNQSPNPHAPEGQAPAPAPVAVATPAPAPAEDLEKLLRHKQALEADLKKLRDKERERDEAAKKERETHEAQLREQMKHADLLAIREKELEALRAETASLTADAEIARALKARKQDVVEAAKADPSTPAWLKTALSSARDVLAASDILDEFRASQTQPASKQPAPPAPSLAGAPPSPAQPNALRTLEDFKRLQAEKPDEFNSIVRGHQPSITQRIGARLTGVGRK